MHWVVLWALMGRNVIVARKQQNQLRRSVFAEVTKAIDNLSLAQYFTINKTDLTILSRATQGAIIFVGVDDNSKLKSLTAPQNGGVLDTLVLEEADAFTEDDFDQLRTRMRGISKFKKKSIMIFNPVSKLKMKWVWDRFFEAVKWDDEVDNEYDSKDLYIKRCTYDMNRFLGQDEITAMESLQTRNPRFWRVFGQGKFGIAGKMVFDGNFRLQDFSISDIRSTRGFTEHHGVDFGFIHKSTLVSSMYDEKNHKIYVYAEIGVREKTKTEFSDIIKTHCTHKDIRNPLLWCDSAEPASIKELKQQGLRTTNAKKGPDSVRRSYDFMQSQEIIIHPSCKQLFAEMETLTYKKRNGEYTEEIDDSSGDDLIAGLRYGYSQMYMNRGAVVSTQLKY